MSVLRMYVWYVWYVCIYVPKRRENRACLHMDLGAMLYVPHVGPPSPEVPAVAWAKIRLLQGLLTAQNSDERSDLAGSVATALCSTSCHHRPPWPRCSWSASWYRWYRTGRRNLGPRRTIEMVAGLGLFLHRTRPHGALPRPAPGPCAPKNTSSGQALFSL